MRFDLGIPLILACLAPAACSITTHGQVETASDVPPTLYYYGGPHFYPDSLGGEWCSIAEPHAHDFPPDHPDYYAYDNGYYYYSGRPGEAYVVGTVPVGVRIHVVRERAPHGPYPLPAQAPPAPHVVTGRWPTREAHPAPYQPPPPQISRRAEPRVMSDVPGRPAPYAEPHRDEHREMDHRGEPERHVEARPDEHRGDNHHDDHHDDHPNDDHRTEPRRVEEHRAAAEPNRPNEERHPAESHPDQARQGTPGPNEAHRAPPSSSKRKKDEPKK